MISRLAFTVFLLVLAAAPSRAFAIQEVTSPGGIKAWLVEDHSIPLIAMSFSFQPGSAADPAGKSGVANFLTGMMDEGAADLDSAQFQKRRDALGMRLSFDAGLDYFEGTFQTLTRNQDGAFDLLRKAITAPRFAAEPIDRMRQSFLLGISEKRDDPQQIAFKAWMNLALPGDPYAIESAGTPEAVAAISAQDLKDAHRRIFNRAALQVSVVGDIDAASLAVRLDKIFAELPKGAVQEIAVVRPISATASVKILSRDIPQSIIVFGLAGLKRDDREFIPAYIMSEILGGGGFNSWLTDEIREKRGLTYGVNAGFSPLRRLALQS